MPNFPVSGMESFDHLTDKTKRFLLVLSREQEKLETKRAALGKVIEERDAVLEKNRKLEALINDLESRRTSFDEKVTTLIDALGEVPLREIS